MREVNIVGEGLNISPSSSSSSSSFLSSPPHISLQFFHSIFPPMRKRPLNVYYIIPSLYTLNPYFPLSLTPSSSFSLNNNYSFYIVNTTFECE
jgi:hypothetical protein